MLEAAAGDHDRALSIMKWPLRALLTAYRKQMRADALATYRHHQLLYQVAAPYLKKGSGARPPELPRILRGKG